MNAPAATSGPAPRRLHLTQEGRAGELFPIVALNVLLTLLTLTVYRFWARTRVRRYLWSTTRLDGDRFEYTGQGLELFLGFAIVLAAVVAPLTLIGFLAFHFWAETDPNRFGAAVTLLYLLGLFLTGVAIYRARRYRLSRTRWRGIRSSLHGSATVYALIHVAVLFLNGITLGWASPWGRVRLVQQMMSHTRFGDRPFRFEGGSGPLYRPFAIFWLGRAAIVILAVVYAVVLLMAMEDAETGKALTEAEILTMLQLLLAMLLAGAGLALLYAAYKARELAYLAQCVGLEGLRFHFDTTTLSLMRLVLGNYLILILSLGLGLPFVQLRNFRYLAARLSAEGSIDFDAIRQSAALQPEVGEGLAEAFDVGAV